MSNVIIIGNGPAGVSASLYTARAGVETTIIGSGLGALGKAEKIENYYGFAEPVDAKELVAAGIAQAKLPSPASGSWKAMASATALSAMPSSTAARMWQCWAAANMPCMKPANCCRSWAVLPS